MQVGDIEGALANFSYRMVNPPCPMTATILPMEGWDITCRNETAMRSKDLIGYALAGAEHGRLCRLICGTFVCAMTRFSCVS